MFQWEIEEACSAINGTIFDPSSRTDANTIIDLFNSTEPVNITKQN